MAGGASRPNEAIVGINVTPLVDVMLVLLIIFMVTANYVANQSIKIELPSAATGESLNKAVNLGFVVDKESNIYLDGKPFLLEQLAVKIAELKSQGKELQALIGADKDAKHGRVVELIDALRTNGVTDFAINIDSQ